jgi:hypothetical protein
MTAVCGAHRVSKDRPKRQSCRASRGAPRHDRTARQCRILSRIGMPAMAVPIIQSRMAAFSALSSNATTRATRQSHFGTPACAANAGRKGSNSIRCVSEITALMGVPFADCRSESARVDRLRARSAAGFDDSFAAVAGRAAVIAVMAGDVVIIARLRRRRSPRAIADDGDWLA